MQSYGSPYFSIEPWHIREKAFSPDSYRRCEGIMALANGYLGQRASFEEGLPDAPALRGHYLAGLFDTYRNPTLITLKGRPDYPCEMVNIPDYLAIEISLDDERLNLRDCSVEIFERAFSMEHGLLTREVVLRTPKGRRLHLSFTRFLSRARKHLAVLRMQATLLEGAGSLTVISRVDGDVRNVNHVHLHSFCAFADPLNGRHGLKCRTQGTGIDLAVHAAERCDSAGEVDIALVAGERESRCRISTPLTVGDPFTLTKLVAIASSRDSDGNGDAEADAAHCLEEARQLGYDRLLQEQQQSWQVAWADIAMEIDEQSGEGLLTQGLRYSLYQMLQNAPNDDPTVNIGAKGLTGEHYVGAYFWDTEIFMLPLFALTDPPVARNLLEFRARTLPAAREKARELGLAGAAFPWMADADGRETSTLWQFSLLGVHIVADVAWASWFYYQVTGDLAFLCAHGIDLLLETSRYWASRVYYREDIAQYVINRVLGPDEYHQGVDNNYYTNIMACENLRACLAALQILQRDDPDGCRAAQTRLRWEEAELARFRDIADRLYLPLHPTLPVRLQDDAFHRLEPYDLAANPPGGALPQQWSYDRIMRTQLLRQADLIVAHLLLADCFTREEIAADFEYYEPKTTHDSSLSFCSYSIIAAYLRREQMAYDYFLRTVRLDLDDLHDNAWMGVHTACLAGAWQCVVFGFAGVRWHGGRLRLAPLLPADWRSFTFTLCWHGSRLTLTIDADALTAHSDGGNVDALLFDTPITITPIPTRFACQTRGNEMGIAG